MSKPIVKEYTDKNVTVLWKPNECIHSEKCFHGLPDVFDPKAKPWVNMDGADNQAIVNQVKQCPSGALSIRYNDEDNASEGSSSDKATKVELMKNGPMIVHGEIEIAAPGGESKKHTGKTALCRCGASSNKPFCDGAHKKVGFEG